MSAFDCNDSKCQLTYKRDEKKSLEENFVNEKPNGSIPIGFVRFAMNEKKNDSCKKIITKRQRNLEKKTKFQVTSTTITTVIIFRKNKNKSIDW